MPKTIVETDQTSKTVRPKPVTSFDATHQENASLTNGFVMAIVTAKTTRTKRGVKPSTLLPVAAASFGAIKQEIVSLTDGFVMAIMTVQTAQTNKTATSLGPVQAAGFSAEQLNVVFPVYLSVMIMTTVEINRTRLTV